MSTRITADWTTLIGQSAGSAAEWFHAAYDEIEGKERDAARTAVELAKAAAIDSLGVSIVVASQNIASALERFIAYHNPDMGD